jgi:hypothetical protein
MPSYGLDVVAIAFAVVLAAALALLIARILPPLADLIMPPPVIGSVGVGVVGHGAILPDWITDR